MEVRRDQELRTNVRRNLFGSVAELADIEHQRATWLDPEMQNPHYGFVEFFERFYDFAGGNYDALDPETDDAPLRWQVDDGMLSEPERDAIWPLHVALRD
ncbi:MAG TPA: hypothetical protein VM265_02590 [Sphingomicrobium sp.]|nr:hypothetical protein [Sphingomicrobium sp.]